VTGKTSRTQGGPASTLSVNQEVATTNQSAQQSISNRVWSREPKSLQDQMTLEAAKRGEGEMKIKSLKDPQYQGMKKMEYKTKSAQGKDSVVHYVKDPKTGKLMDFKFKKHSTD